MGSKFKTIKVKESVYEKLKKYSEEMNMSIPDIIERITRNMNIEVLPDSCKPWSEDVVYCYDSSHGVWVPCLVQGVKLLCYDIETNTYKQRG